MSTIEPVLTPSGVTKWNILDEGTGAIMGTLKMAAGENFVGNTSGISVAKSFVFTRPANTTAYTAKDAVGVNLAASAATNASPIVVTTPAHGLADGDPITISGMVGNTAGNGNFFAKVLSSTTFALYSDKALTTPVAGNGDWSSGGAVARLFRLADIFRLAGGSGYVMKARVRTDLSTCVEQFKLHFYSMPVTALLDNAVFTLLFANAPAHLGDITMPAMATEGTGSDSAMATATSGAPAVNGAPLAVRNNDGTRDLYVRIEDLTAGTPASAQNYYLEVTVMEG